jgi:hypothetical protein
MDRFSRLIMDVGVNDVTKGTYWHQAVITPGLGDRADDRGRADTHDFGDVIRREGEIGGIHTFSSPLSAENPQFIEIAGPFNSDNFVGAK